MKMRRVFTAALLLAMLLLALPAGTALAQGTDEIKEYAIEITPQSDGSLISDYAVDWCVVSDAAGPLSWITLGMPNEQYEVLSYSGDAASVRPDNSAFDYLVRIDLAREANAGDCVNINVKVRQSGLAYLDEEKNEVYYQFTPGWFNDVPVDHLKITWNLPSDTSLVKSYQPQPGSQSETQAVWETRLDAGDKFSVNLTYERAAFPDLTVGQSAPAPATGAAPLDSGQAPAGPSAPAPTETSQPGFFETAFGIVCICIIIIVALIILIIIIRAISSSTSSYRGGGYFGGYHGSGWTGGGSSGGGSIFGSGGGSVGRSERSGGGSGLFGGRGSSCACVSSGCACACAGGGRAGCSRKGFDVSSLFDEREKRGDEE